MKKLLLLAVLMISGCIYSQSLKFTTQFPETTSWSIRNNVLYADYVHSEKGLFRKKVYEYREPGTNEKIWFIKYPDYNFIYTVRIKNNTVIGVLDVDSVELSTFDDIDKEHLIALCEWLVTVI